jgi:hypothetical protein
VLTVRVVLEESFDEATNMFDVELFDLRLEHSLVSLSKWESKFKKPFLGKDEKSSEEWFWYIRFMCLEDVPKGIFEKITDKNILEIQEYINDPMTATWFSDVDDGKPAKETITSELIYYWMVAYTIPFTCEDWHLSRLLTLVKVCNQKNQPPKKMSAQEIASRQRDLNAKRKAQHNTSG